MRYDLDVNQSTNSTPSIYGDNASPIFVLFSIVLSVWIILFNTFVLICFIQNRRLLLKNTFAIQICQLCVCDIYVGLSTMPVYISGFSKGIRFEFCVFSFVLFISSQVVVLFHILGICLYRLRIVSRVMAPNRVKVEKTGHMLVYLLVINGIVSIGIFIVPFFIWGNYRQTLHICSLPEIFTESYKSALTYCILFYIVPALLTNAVYIIIIVKLCCSSQRPAKQENDFSSQENDSAVTLTKNEASTCGDTPTLVKSTMHDKQDNYIKSSIASAECHKIYAISFKQKQVTGNKTDSQQASTSVGADGTSIKALDRRNGDQAEENETEEKWTVRFEQVDLHQRAKSAQFCFDAQKRAIVLTGIFCLF